MHKSEIYSRSELFVQQFYADHEDAITLIGHDTHTDDFIETPHGSNPDAIQYYTRSIERHEFNVTGFVFKHPHGAIITAEFAKPILAIERTLETDGAEIDGNTYENNIEQAIVAKLGNIAALRDVNLI